LAVVVLHSFGWLGSVMSFFSAGGGAKQFRLAAVAQVGS